MLQAGLTFARRERWLLAIAAVTALLRIPYLFEPLWYRDEAIYLTIGQQILRGDLLYVDVFDHKPPGVYYVAAGALAIFGHSVAAIKVALLGWSLASLAAVYALGVRLLDRSAAIWAAGIFALLVTPPWLEGEIFGSEPLMILTTCLGMLLGLRGRPFLAGICFGASLLFKVPAILDFGGFFVFTALGIERGYERQTLSALARLTAGLATPVLLTIVFFGVQGALPDYYEAVLTYNVNYTGTGNHLVFEHGRLVLNAVLPALLVAALGFLAYRRWRTGEGHAPGALQFVLLWLAFAFYGVLLGGRPYEHYLLQAAAPFALLAALTVTRVGVSRYAGTAALLVVSAVTIGRDFHLGRDFYFSYYPNFIEYATGTKSFDDYAFHLDGYTPGNYRIADFLRQDSGGADEPIYVYTHEPAIYFRSGMDPASKYVAYYQVAPDEKRKLEAADELARARPLYIIAEEARNESFQQLDRMLSERYELVLVEGTIQVYKRAD